MLFIDDAGREWLARLEKELAWLRENHPEKTALAGVAESHLDTIRRAGSCATVSTIPALFAQMETVR